MKYRKKPVATANAVPDPLDTIARLREERDGLRDVRIPSMQKHWGDALNDLAKLEAANKRLRDLVEAQASRSRTVTPKA